MLFEIFKTQTPIQRASVFEYKFMPYYVSYHNVMLRAYMAITITKLLSSYQVPISLLGMKR